MIGIRLILFALATGVCTLSYAAAAPLHQFFLSDNHVNERSDGLSVRYHPPLRFDRGKFKILVLSDTHFNDDEGIPGHTPVTDKKSASYINNYLDAEQPDFVVHLGDMISGEQAKSTADVEKAIDTLLQPMSK